MDRTLDPPWIDASRPLGAATPVWPGDQPFELRQQRGAHMVLSAFLTTCHVGTHLDAPLHLGEGKPAVDEISLSRLMGAAELIHPHPTDRPLTPADLPRGWQPTRPRLLLRTDSFPLGATPGPGFASLDASLVHWLADRQVDLVGIDTPSVDPFEDEEMTAHRTLEQRGLLWIEGLWLGGIGPGLVQMIALPLPLVGVEAAPLRVLIKEAT